MSAKAVFTMKLDAQLCDEFMAATTADNRSATQVVAELMRNYIEQQHQAHEYNGYLQRKIEIARKQRDAGLHFSNEEVEAEAAARRMKLLQRDGEAGF